ncbi:MAG: hypothetical protein R8G34_21865 [Paracoccaceae bacterium]|nr:hypothetical protein [Paracoccaceae bacterium]
MRNVPVRQETVLVMAQAFWRVLSTHRAASGAHAQIRIRARNYSICDIFRTFTGAAVREMGWNFQATLAVLGRLARRWVAVWLGQSSRHMGAR